MKKLSYFLMVGLAFTVLQVSTVAAQTGDPNIAPPTGTSGMPPMGAPVLTIDDPKCDGSDGPPRTDCPNYGQPPTSASGMPPTMAPPMGDPCMVHPPGPARDTCYSSMSGSSMPPGAPHMPPGAPGMPPTMAPPAGQ